MAGRGGGRRPPQEIPVVFAGRRLLAGKLRTLFYFSFSFSNEEICFVRLASPCGGLVFDSPFFFFLNFGSWK